MLFRSEAEIEQTETDINNSVSDFVKLTTMSQNLSQKAQMAVEAVLDPSVRERTLEVKLVERESVKHI